MPETSSETPELSVVVPLYDEEGNVGPLQDEVERVLKGRPYELILVDDGSTDETVAKIRREPHVRVLQLAENMGQSAAMYAGIMAAKAPLIALMDGDMQNDPADLPKLIEEIEKGADLVCGYRQNRQDTTSKRIQSKIANGVRSRMTGDGVRDTGCSLKVMRQECREALVPFTGMHRFIPALIKGAGYKIVEFGVNHRERASGDSKYGKDKGIEKLTGGLKRAKPATEDMFGVMWLNSRRFTVRLKEDEPGEG